MIIKQKEKELESFKLAKKYFNSNPKEYDKSLEELNKISFLIKNITIIHMKTLCLLMLAKYEDIIEFYYLNKNYLNEMFDQNNNNGNEIEQNEIRKIISLAFYNCGMRQKAKKICPEIKDDYQIETFNFEIKGQNRKNEEITVENNINENQNTLNSNRINKNIILKNIKKNLDENIQNKKNEEEINQNQNQNNNNNNNVGVNDSKDLVPITTDFVEDLFQNAIQINKMKKMQKINEKNIEKEIQKNNEDKKENLENKGENENGIKDGDFIEADNGTKISNGSKKSNDSNIYAKLKEEINLNNINNLKKENGLYMTFEEKLKDNQIEKKENKDDKKLENEKKDEGNNDNKKENENIKSNRSEKSQKLKELKGPLNNQKIPFVKKFTKQEVSVNINLGNNNKNKKENISEKKIEEKEIKNEEDVKIEENKNIDINIENKEAINGKENKDIIKNEIEKNKEEKKENNNKSNNNNNTLKKSFTIDKSITFINKDIKRIYPKANNNDKNNGIRKDNSHENNKRISDGFIKNCRTYGFKNPFEFTLNPEEGGSFKPISSYSSQNEKNEEDEEKKSIKEQNININGKKDENKKEDKNEEGVNINKNRALLRVEIDGEQIDLIPNENPSRKNSKYGDYINIDYTEFSNKKRKQMIDKFKDSALKNFDLKYNGQLPKSTKINSFNLRGIKNRNPLSENEGQSDNGHRNTQTNLKKTCFYKTSYFLDNFDNK